MLYIAKLIRVFLCRIRVFEICVSAQGKREMHATGTHGSVVSLRSCIVAPLGKRERALSHACRMNGSVIAHARNPREGWEHVAWSECKTGGRSAKTHFLENVLCAPCVARVDVVRESNCACAKHSGVLEAYAVASLSVGERQLKIFIIPLARRRRREFIYFSFVLYHSGFIVRDAVC